MVKLVDFHFDFLFDVCHFDFLVDVEIYFLVDYSFHCDWRVDFHVYLVL